MQAQQSEEFYLFAQAPNSYLKCGGVATYISYSNHWRVRKRVID